MNSEWYYLMNYATMLGAVELTVLVSLLLSAFMLIKGKIKEIFWVNIVIYGGVAFNFLMKLVFQRERPGDERLLEAFGFSFEMASYSFPSGHTMRITLLVLALGFFILQITSLSFWNRIFIILSGILLILLVASSRVYLDYHYVSDSVAAITLALVYFSGMIWLRRKMNLSISY